MQDEPITSPATGFGTRPGSKGTYAFFVLAFAFTWALDFPFVWACANGTAPPSYAFLMAGFGSLGPTLAATIVAARHGELRSVFGRWHTHPVWIVVGLAVPAAIHTAANIIEVALGGHPTQWFYPPVRPEHVAALVMFSLGEEFGWRGFAYPRLADRSGPIVGSLVVGALWGLWHFGMLFTPEHGAPDAFAVFQSVITFALWSVIMAWLFERGSRSMAVAIAFHAGGHLDDYSRIPETEVRLRVLHLVVLAAAAIIAARALVETLDLQHRRQ